MRKQLGYLPGTEPHYTVKKRIETWFYHYKWWLLAAIVVAVSLAPVVKNILGIGVVKPDYTVMCVTAAGLREETARELTATLESAGEDVNGDGIVRVELIQARTGAGDRETALYLNYASTVTIQANLQSGVGHFFVLEDPAGFQISYQALADGAGKLPEDGDLSAEGRYVPFDTLNLSLSEEAAAELSRMSFAQRGYYKEASVAHLAEYRALWQRLTEGN